MMQHNLTRQQKIELYNDPKLVVKCKHCRMKLNKDLMVSTECSTYYNNMLKY